MSYPHAVRKVFWVCVVYWATQVYNPPTFVAPTPVTVVGARAKTSHCDRLVTPWIWLL